MKKRNSSDVLKTQLDSYSTAAKSSARLAMLRQRMGSWPAYAAVTGSALAAATSASAFQIVSYSGPPVTASFTGNNGTAHTGVLIGIAPEFSIAVGRHSINGFSDFIKAGEGQERIPSSGRHAQYGGAFAGIGLAKVTSHGVLKDFAFGQPVNTSGGNYQRPGSSFQPGSIMKSGRAITTFRSGQTYKSFFGKWKPGVPGFVGFGFNTTGSGDQFNYGWAEVEFNTDSNNLPISVTLLGLAYDANGLPINAGQTAIPATPEPGTAGLILLALGAAGVTVLKKSHGQRNEPPASDTAVTD